MAKILFRNTAVHQGKQTRGSGWASTILVACLQFGCSGEDSTTTRVHVTDPHVLGDSTEFVSVKLDATSVWAFDADTLEPLPVEQEDANSVLVSERAGAALIGYAGRPGIVHGARVFAVTHADELNLGFPHYGPRREGDIYSHAPVTIQGLAPWEFQDKVDVAAIDQDAMLEAVQRYVQFQGPVQGAQTFDANVPWERPYPSAEGGEIMVSQLRLFNADDLQYRRIIRHFAGLESAAGGGLGTYALQQAPLPNDSFGLLVDYEPFTDELASAQVPQEDSHMEVTLEAHVRRQSFGSLHGFRVMDAAVGHSNSPVDTELEIYVPEHESRVARLDLWARVSLGVGDVLTTAWSRNVPGDTMNGRPWEQRLFAPSEITINGQDAAEDYNLDGETLELAWERPAGGPGGYLVQQVLDQYSDDGTIIPATRFFTKSESLRVPREVLAEGRTYFRILAIKASSWSLGSAPDLEGLDVEEASAWTAAVTIE